MNSYILFRAGIDVQAGIQRFSGNKALYEKYLYEFFENEYFDRLEKALLEEKKEEAFQSAHALKGIAGNLSIQSFYDAICPLVEALRGEPDFQTAKKQMKEVREQYGIVQEAIRASHSSMS